MPNGDGNGKKWQQGLIHGLSITVALLVGVAAGGAYMGGQAAMMKSHIENVMIHETPQQKQDRINKTIDREVAPSLKRIEEELSALRKSVDEIKERR